MRRRILELLLITGCLLTATLFIPSPTRQSTVAMSAPVRPPISWTALQQALDTQAWWYATVQAQAAAKPVVVTLPHKQAPSGTVEAAASAPSGLEPCGGDLPPCWVKRRESRGNYSAYNPTGCGGRGCGGAWQFDPKTWNGYGGYAEAQDAPPDVQDAKAREVWAGGSGCAHWAACG